MASYRLLQWEAHWNPDYAEARLNEASADGFDVVASIEQGGRSFFVLQQPDGSQRSAGFRLDQDRLDEGRLG